MDNLRDNLSEPQNIFGSKELKRKIIALKGRFFTLEEFPFIGEGVLPRDTLKRALRIPESEITYFALSLRGKEIDGLILELRDASDHDSVDMASRILELRTSARILKLLTILYQYNYASIGLKTVISRMFHIIKERKTFGREAAFIDRFGAETGKFTAVCRAIDECGMDIDQCFRTFNIHSDSPFAAETALLYLENANKDALMLNRRWMIRSVERHEPDRLFGLIANYLSAFAIIELHDGVNLAILNKIGQPYMSVNWGSYDIKLREKFAQWCFLHQLKLHSYNYPKKFTVLSKYYEQVINSYTIDEENLLVIDFGDLVLVDMAANFFSLFYDKETFESEMKDWRKSKAAQAGEEAEIQEAESQEAFVPSFLRINKKYITARDFIIEEIEEPSVMLSYEGLELLYIQEMLDIKMGLEPDMRKKQLAKLRKKNPA